MKAIEAYNFLFHKDANENRTLMERNSVYLLACSFLFLGFVEAEVEQVRMAIAALGIVLSFMIFYLNQAALNALLFWQNAQELLEGEPQFRYMRSRQITLHHDAWDCILGHKQLARNKKGAWRVTDLPKWKFWRRVPQAGPLLTYAVPGLFLLLWIFALLSISWFPIDCI